ncbi:succinate dehydrogenase cytochrome b560 subunit [Zalerion maritima]|uniref:Succinate dehydrogenase cytochrome b560 subunit n=1 Tax=Zalerion maritima TaxID=339359 RepID=A0AAD5WVM0_9PEZI|nr:succinate dehydrogenase cytochrome b560 subunit [Zalerion maritima]
MNVQRVGLRAVRRVAAKPSNVFPKVLAASLMQFRPAATTTLPPSEAEAQLAAQRLKRPLAPHLSIYKYDQTWFGASAWQRITGGILSCGLYGYSLIYLVAPLAGIHVESASLAAFVATLPAVVKGGIKFGLAWPFTFHSFNGVRHLVMDSGFAFSKKAIFVGGWGVWGMSLVTALGLVALY